MIRHLSLVLLVVAVAALGFSLRTYRVLTREELVAEVVCERASAGEAGFVIRLTPVQSGEPELSLAEDYPMTGDQWSVGGDFLKWHSWLNLMGLSNRHKLTRLSSRYWNASDEMAKPRAAYDLNGGSSHPWRWLYQHGIRLPFVDAVYGTAAYVPAQPGRRWGVYVGPTGYLLRPLAPKGKS